MSTNVLVEAKKELTKHIINRISPFFYEEFRKLHNKCIVDCNEAKKPNILEEFGKKLKNVPEWNQNLIDELFERLQQTCTRQILSNLIKSVWIANVQILSAVRMNKTETETEVNVPDPKRFVHKCFVECAREIYKDPYLFDPNVDTMQLHRNQRDLLKLISRSTKDGIRKMLPVEDILRQYLSTDTAAIAAGEISDQELKNILNDFEKDDTKKNKEESSDDDDVKRESVDEDDEDFVPSTNSNREDDRKDESEDDKDDKDDNKKNGDDDDTDKKSSSRDKEEDKKVSSDEEDSDSHRSDRHRSDRHRSDRHRESSDYESSGKDKSHRRHRGDEAIEVPINDTDTDKSSGGLFFTGVRDKRP
jgi:hypothetical protein